MTRKLELEEIFYLIGKMLKDYLDAPNRLYFAQAYFFRTNIPREMEIELFDRDLKVKFEEIGNGYKASIEIEDRG